MAYTLEQFCKDCHDALKADSGDSGQEKVRQQLEHLLTNQEFVVETCGPNAERGVHTLYQDPELGFMVLAHIYEKGVKSPPHDHGPSWAVYGQAVKHTNMTVWRRTDDGSEEGHAKVEPKSEYRLDPGMAGVFHPGDIHSIDFPDGARFVRITGTDLNYVAQKRFNLKEGTVDTTKPVPPPEGTSQWAS